jgi:hypothetical protein
LAGNRLNVSSHSVAVHAVNRNIARAGHDQTQDRAAAHAFFARYFGVATLPQGADIFEQRPDIRAIHVLATRTADQQIAGTQIEFRETAGAEWPQAHASGGWVVNQHRAIMRTDEFHAHETGFPEVVANMLLAAGMEGADGDTIGFDRLVMLDGGSQRAGWNTDEICAGERCGKHHG